MGSLSPVGGGPKSKRVDGDAATGEITNATMSRATASGQKKKRKSTRPQTLFSSTDQAATGESSIQPLVEGITEEGDEDEEVDEED